MVAVPVDVPAADASVNALLMASLTAGAAPSASASSLLDAAVGAALAPGGALVEGLAGDPADDDGEEGRGEVAVAAHFAGQSFLPGSSFMPPMPPGQGGVGGGGADEKGEKSLPPQQLGSPSKRSPSPVVGAGKISCPVCQLAPRTPPYTPSPMIGTNMSAPYDSDMYFRYSLSICRAHQPQEHTHPLLFTALARTSSFTVADVQLHEQCPRWSACLRPPRVTPSCPVIKLTHLGPRSPLIVQGWGGV